jgi:dihydroorotate dehydrogenase electron transfer subunit
VTTLLAEAELVESRAILPGQWIGSFHAPHVASGARAGQFVHLRDPDPTTELLRRSVPLNTADPSTGIVTLHVRTPRSRFGDPSPVGRLRAGDRVGLVGPFGRPFEVDPRSRHLLLIAAGLGVAALRMLADEAVRDGRQVTLLFGAPAARDVYPSSLLPDEVEYVVATADGSLGHHGPVTDLVPAYEAWADQAFAAGPRTLLAELARHAAGRRERMGVANLGRKRGGGRPEPMGSATARRKAFLQVALDQPVGCAAATCLGCAVLGAGGVPLRTCREGPVFSAPELDWDALP